MALKKFLTIGFVAAVLVACGDNGRDLAPRLTRDSSSSETVILSSNEGSCSSGEQSSSSVVYEDPSTVVNGSMSDKRDGKTYKTVKIGEQWWMAENLNYHSTKSWCYGNNGADCTKYGRLYLWGTAMDGAGMWSMNGKGCDLFKKVCSPTYPVRGVCPEGWHLPDRTEWETLFAAVGGKTTAGKMLKSIRGWNSSGNGADAYSFAVLPVGSRYYGGGDFVGEGLYACFWSSSENNSRYAYAMCLRYSNDKATLWSSDKYDGFSVRCVMD
jgi:uncharacterized protein (TIGR02145 family)